MSKLQVCISVYKKSIESLERAINSIPSYADIRVDFDGGWDYQDMKFEIEKKYPNISIHIQDENKGLAFIRNMQIDECWTEYLMFLDADDQLIGYNVGSDGTPTDDKIKILLEQNYDLILAPVLLHTSKKNYVEYRNLNVRYSGQTLHVLPSIIFSIYFLRLNQIRFIENGMRFEDVIPSVQLTQLLNGKNWHNVGYLYEPFYQYNLDSEDSLSKPKDQTEVIESTIEVIKMLKFNRFDKQLAYIRATEEALRLFSLGDQLPNEDREKVIDLLKPYKFF